MRHLIVFFAACGAAPPAPPASTAPEMRAASLEWKAEQADEGRVDVTLVVDGKAQPLGHLDATTEMEAGTPATCGLRAAHATRTELMCGAANYYAAELQAGVLVISIFDGVRMLEVKRIPLEVDAIAVKPYAL